MKFGVRRAAAVVAAVAALALGVPGLASASSTPATTTVSTVTPHSAPAPTPVTVVAPTVVQPQGSLVAQDGEFVWVESVQGTVSVPRQWFKSLSAL